MNLTINFSLIALIIIFIPFNKGINNINGNFLLILLIKLINISILDLEVILLFVIYFIGSKSVLIGFYTYFLSWLVYLVVPVHIRVDNESIVNSVIGFVPLYDGVGGIYVYFLLGILLLVYFLYNWSCTGLLVIGLVLYLFLVYHILMYFLLCVDVNEILVRL